MDKCVEHLLHQTIGIDEMEIILVDDASTDDGGTKARILQYEQRFPDTIIAVLLEKNLRQGGARNMGISYASGEYVLFCDADDWILEETLEHCYDAAKKFDADIVGFGRQIVKEHGALAALKKGDNDHLVELDTEEKKRHFLFDMSNDSYSSQNKLFRLSMIQKHHITFVEHLFIEEYSFTVPARLYAERFYFLDEALYIYYMSPGSTMRGDWEQKKWDNLKAWLFLMEDLENRGLQKLFFEELEYLFFELGFGLSLQMVFQAGCILEKSEWEMIIDIVLKVIPGICENRYIVEEQLPVTRMWNELLLALLNMSITDESADVANRSVSKVIWEIRT